MKTDAVMCMALTRTRPSRTPLFLTTSWIWGVMLTKAIRAGRLNVRYSVCAFMGGHDLASYQVTCFPVVRQHERKRRHRRGITPHPIARNKVVLVGGLGLLSARVDR